MNRELVLLALFNLLSNAASFATVSRRLRLWSSVAPADKPALIMVDKTDVYQRASEAVPEAITMQIDVYIYTDAGSDQSGIPSTALNTLLDAVDTALLPDRLTGKQTLGGLVSHCWIEGRVMKDAGDIDGNGVAVIPIRILIPR